MSITPSRSWRGSLLHRAGRSLVTALLLLASSAAPTLAQDEDDDNSTDSLGEQKGSDRVDASESKVDRSNSNTFEKERFFIDKIDTAETEEKTLFQGNLISTTFFYKELGDTLKVPMGNVGGGTTTNSDFNRLFTDLRLQLDARHIAGGRWLSRVDVRGRLVNDPGQNTTAGYGGKGDNRVQSGFAGQSELDVKDLWVARPGDRFDVFIGRQTIPDLGAVKIDGVRIDYAKSDKVTMIGFAGAYPVRGSRSIDTDYPQLRDENNKSLGKKPPIAAGIGAAYRTPLSYGSIGGGAIVPLKGEKPRVFLTSTGYYRTGPKLDLYHFALVDVVSEGGFAINNLSGGLNYRLAPTLRATASVNHVDTETLEIQARSFLEPTTGNVVLNDAQVRRISSTQAQGGLSAGFGRTQQLEVSVAVSGRYRPEVSVLAGATPVLFKESKSVDVLGQIVHRDLFSSRVGVDVIRSFSIGETSARSAFLTLRAFLSREFRRGRGSWEGEVSYSNTKDEFTAMSTGFNDFGKSKTSTLGAGGTVYYRLRTSWFLMGSLGIGRFGLESAANAVVTTDPTLTSISTFIRLAYRF